MSNYYAGSSKYAAVSPWAASTAYTVGQIVRQLTTPAVNSERCYICQTAGTSSGTEPAWTTTKNVTLTDGTVTWREITGRNFANGDAADVSTWAASTARVVGDVIKDVAGTHYLMCTTAGTSKSGSEPSWSLGAVGNATTDGTATFKYIGLVSSFGAYGAPIARLSLVASFLDWMGSSGVCYVSNNHAETQASAIANTLTTLNEIICVDDAVVPPTTLAYTASMGTTGNNIMGIVAGFWSGINFNVGSVANSVNGSFGNDTVNSTSYGARFRRCSFNMGGTTGGTLNLAGDFELTDNDFTFASTAHVVNLGVTRGFIQGGSFAATGTVPTTLLTCTGAGTRLSCVDLSAVNTTLVAQATIPKGTLIFDKCKLHASVNKMSQPASLLSTSAIFYNCHSGVNNHEFDRVAFNALASDDTSIYRSGGATDGVTPLSYAITTSSVNANRAPFHFEEIVFYNDSVGSSKTVTLYLTTDTALTNKDVYVRLKYLGSSASPLGSIASTRAILPASATALNTSSVTWNGSAKTYKYEIPITFTPQMPGEVAVELYVAKAGVSLWLCPLPGVV